MCARADDLPSAAWMPMRAVTRPRATCALMASRTGDSSISSSRGRFTEISDCRRLTALNSTVILNPSRAHSPRP